MSLAAAVAVVACRPEAVEPAPVATETATATEPSVELVALSEGLWRHTTIRETQQWGRVVSHGLVVEHPSGPVLVDTAWGEGPTQRLLELVEARLGRAPRAAIVTDFHADRAGGAGVLQDAGVPLWTSRGIAARIGMSARALSLPSSGEQLGGLPVEVYAPGAGHSSQNLVVWLPEHRTVFGGCLVRPFDSRGLGNVADADLDAWGPSIRAVKERYPSAQVIIPSHGDPGGVELLDHTLALVESGVAARAKTTGAPPPPTRVAITVDDLPRHGPVPPGVSRTEIHTALLEAFERHGVPDVRGFVIGGDVDSNEDHREALRRWLAAGHPLGNHTFSHPDLRKMSVEDYIADIDRNESVLARLTADHQGTSWRSFRYPYLQQGVDVGSTPAISRVQTPPRMSIAETTIVARSAPLRQTHGYGVIERRAEAESRSEKPYRVKKGGASLMAGQSSSMQFA